MKTIIGAIALTLAVPAFAQTTPAADPHAQHQGMDHSKHKQASGQHNMQDMQKHCEEMMKHHGKDHGAKSPAGTGTTADHKDHQGHAQ